MELTAVLTPAEEGGFVAFNPETGTTTQGETVDEALANLREATGLFLDEIPDAVPPQGSPDHPWLPFAGMFKDDPMFDHVQAEIAAYRREIDADDEAV